MNHKINWTKRGRISGAVSGIPVRFDPDSQFDVKVKKSSGKSRMSHVEPPLVLALFGLHIRGSQTHAHVQRMPMEDRMLDPRRLEALFKLARKKRC